MMSWLKQAWTWVRKLPVARTLKPIWKSLLRDIIQEEGDALQARVKAAVAVEGPAAIDRNIDSWQAALKRRLEALPLPIGMERKILDTIQVQGDGLQAALKNAVAVGGPAGVDVAFDAAQEALLERIGLL